MSKQENFIAVPKNERERRVAKHAAIVGAAAIMGIDILGNSMGWRGREAGRIEGLEQPSPIERIIDVDTETFDELDIDKGTLVYNDTTDTYVVYVDDTEANPAQDSGWYEIDMNKLVAPE